MSIRIHNARCLGKGEGRNVFRVTIACTTCKSAIGQEHRIDFDYEPLREGPTRAHREAADHHGMAARREQVLIMAEAGCLDAQHEVTPR